MQTVIIKDNDNEALSEAALMLKEGHLVAFPTETVYGLGANALDSKAVEEIFKVKGRPSDNPLILHISSTSQINSIVREIPQNAKKLMEAFWPGPLTIVLKKTDHVPDIVTAGLDTVAVRMPENPLALKLIELSGVPVAAPSANLSGRPSPTSAEHVFADLSGRIQYIIDGGACAVGLESTVIDLSGSNPVILRPGGITREMLLEVLENVETDPALESNNDKPRSPGMKYRHYSPRADMFLVKGIQKDVINAINNLVKQKHEEGMKVGVLTCFENSGKYEADEVVSAGSACVLNDVASRLYDALRKFDETDVDVIYSEVFNEQGIGHAVMNRLKKASSGRVIEA